MIISALGVGSLAKLRGERILPPGAELPSILLISAIFLLEHLCLLYALQYLKVVVAMSLIYTYPFMIAGVSVLSGKLRSGIFLFSMLAVCLAGVIMVIGFSADAMQPAGIVFALLQAAMATARIMLTSRLLKDTGGLVLTTRMLVFAVLLGLPVMAAVPLAGPESMAGWIAVCTAGLSGMVGHSCLAQALKRISAVSFGVMMNLEPVSAAVLTAVIAGQLLTAMQYTGAVLVVVAVAAYGWKRAEAEQ